MTGSANTNQWIIFGWPLDNEGHLRKEVNARLYSPTTDGNYTVAHGTVPLDTVGLERIDNFEVAPGMVALNQVPSAQCGEFLKDIPDNNSQRSKTTESKLLRKHGRHASWTFTEFTVLLSRIQHATLEAGSSDTYNSQRTLTDWETAREICYQIVKYFGFRVLRNATIIHEPNNPNLHHQTLRITFESPVTEPSLLHGNIERNVGGIITLSLWYRFTTSSPWYKFCNRSLDNVGEIDLIEPMRAMFIELINFAEHDFTRDEIISHLGRFHDLVDNSEWSQSHLDATDVVEDQAESSLRKLEQMLPE